MHTSRPFLLLFLPFFLLSTAFAQDAPSSMVVFKCIMDAKQMRNPEDAGPIGAVLLEDADLIKSLLPGPGSYQDYIVEAQSRYMRYPFAAYVSGENIGLEGERWELGDGRFVDRDSEEAKRMRKAWEPYQKQAEKNPTHWLYSLNVRREMRPEEAVETLQEYFPGGVFVRQLPTYGEHRISFGVNNDTTFAPMKVEGEEFEAMQLDVEKRARQRLAALVKILEKEFPIKEPSTIRSSASKGWKGTIFFDDKVTDLHHHSQIHYQVPEGVDLRPIKKRAKEIGLDFISSDWYPASYQVMIAATTDDIEALREKLSTSPYVLSVHHLNWNW